jgi:hypothetical protein
MEEVELYLKTKNVINSTLILSDCCNSSYVNVISTYQNKIRNCIIYLFPWKCRLQIYSGKKHYHQYYCIKSVPRGMSEFCLQDLT